MPFDPFLLRAIERILAVVIGGLAIYFGYRLFLAVPDQQGEGRAELTLAKDKRLLLTRIGPGTFFALFGTAVVVSSYYFPVALTDADRAYSGLGTATATAAGPLVVPPAPPPEAAATARAIALLNASLDAGGDAARIREAKLALMAGGWQRDWGDPLEFPIWLDQAPRPPRPEFERALAVYEARE